MEALYLQLYTNGKVPFSQTHFSTTFVGPHFSDPEVKYLVSYHLIVKKKCCNLTKKTIQTIVMVTL